MQCERCKKTTDTFRMSIFNQQHLCMDCIQKETQHPDYQKAKNAEHQAVLSGDFNFPCIGLPDDYEI